MMESRGAQCLLLAGFFADQMRGRHNVRWYAALGAGFYHRAAEHSRTSRNAQVMAAMAQNFTPWCQRHTRLSRELRDQPYLLDEQELGTRKGIGDRSRRPVADVAPTRVPIPSS